MLRPGSIMAISSLLGLTLGGLMGAAVGFPVMGVGLGIAHSAAAGLVLIVMLPNDGA